MSARFGQGTIAGGLVLACLGMAGAASAQYDYEPGYRGNEPGQAPAAPAATGTARPGIIYTNKRAFNLPVAYPERDRAKLKGLCLFWKTPAPGSEWTRYTTVSPQADKFVFKAKDDGEYWFIVATIGLDGHVNSPLGDPRYVERVLKVVIDTQPPAIDVQSMKSPEGDVYVRCNMVDDNPNPASLRLICRGELGEIELRPLEKFPDTFQVSRKAGVPVRVEGSDLCKNGVSQNVSIKEFADAGPGLGRPDSGSRDSFSPPPPGGPQSIGQGMPMSSPGDGPTIRNTGDGLTQTRSIDGTIENSDKMIAAAKGEFPAIDGRGLPGNALDPSQRFPIANPSIPQPTVNTDPPPIPMVGGSVGATGSTGASATSALNSLSGNRSLLNTSQVSVHYRIEPVGVSGVGKVQIWITDDQGQTWKLLKEDVGKHSPADVRLPGEGLFGISVVVTNGNGFGGTPPRNGEAPSSWIEVDTTKPFVQFQPIEIVPNGGGLEIRWTASDKNLAAEPISLFYSTTQGGPWNRIASGNLKNDGHYRWAVPKGTGTEFYFKIEAVDQVGNQAHAATNIPLVLDLTEPKGFVVRVSGR